MANKKQKKEKYIAIELKQDIIRRNGFSMTRIKAGVYFFDGDEKDGLHKQSFWEKEVKLLGKGQYKWH